MIRVQWLSNLQLIYWKRSRFNNIHQMTYFGLAVKRGKGKEKKKKAALYMSSPFMIVQAARQT